MSSAIPAAEEARLNSAHGGTDGLSVAQESNPMAGVRRPARSPMNSPFDAEHRGVIAAEEASGGPEDAGHTSDHHFGENDRGMTLNPMHSGARGSEAAPIPLENLGLDVPKPAAKTGWGIASGAKKLFSSALGTIGRAASAAKHFTLGIPGAMSRGFQSLRSSVKSNSADYSSAASTVAQHTMDPLLDRVGTKKFSPEVDSESLGWKSRTKQADGSMAITDPHEIAMHAAVKGGKSDVKSLLHDKDSGLTDDERADLVRKHLLKTHKLKQSGEGGLYDKAIAKARAEEGTTASAQSGQVLAEASEGAIRLAGSAPAKLASHLGTALTGVSVSNVVKHSAMLTKTAGQYALDHDPERQARADSTAEELASSHKEMKKTFNDYRGARGAWAGHQDDELADGVKENRSNHLKGNFQALYSKLNANKADVVARSAAGRGGELLDEMKMKHTNAIDKTTGQVIDRDQRPAGVHPQYGMPMGSDTGLGRAGQGLRSASESVEFGGKVITGSGAQEFLDKGDYGSAAMISTGALATEAASAAAAGVVPVGGGHGTKAVVKGTGYAMMAAGKGGAELGKKLASKQDQHDRYMDVISGQRSEDAAAHPINFQGAVSNHDPGGLQGAYEKTRDGIRDEGKKGLRKLLGADKNA